MNLPYASLCHRPRPQGLHIDSEGEVQGSHGQSGGFDGVGALLAEAPIFGEHLLTFEIPLQGGSLTGAQDFTVSGLPVTTHPARAGTGIRTAHALAKWWAEAKTMLSRMPVD